ncbi:p-hydroxyphenylpyruvate dioxygenase [Dunaliella salina]|uniref:4-hydroxyphenylpyruvate dioxygenase n=1 Tax=Dunaliella salina TaxID=3046 RepID=A0ABQ7G986_DUNSA|nr:p-hydroxyphenylpyruvate dioxygenase [Dunaliella salina]|eukprot:KAF5831174.1 p-hydroxyphenylpyruvate dioxygenase [Dunaliella salina]
MQATNMAMNGNSTGFQLKGAANFKRHNPKTDKFFVHRFHSVEFWCADATNTYKRFQHGLGMTLVARSDQSTGNSAFASYVLRSNELVFTFTAPYAKSVSQNSAPGCVPLPHYTVDDARAFIASHGLAVKALGLVVEDANVAFETSVQNGAIPATPPFTLQDKSSGLSQVVAEVKLYGDVVLRYISGNVVEVPYLVGYTPVTDTPPISYGLRRLDHAVGNVHNLCETMDYIMKFTGFHEFCEFTAEDVGTVDSGLNSVVLANNNEYVLMPVNEPTFNTPRKSQIQTFLEQNEGPGMQHLALKTDDIITTLTEMRKRSQNGGFDFMPRPSDKYYRDLPKKVGNSISPSLLAQCEDLGILVDKDECVCDRPTIFIEIIQRVGCMAGDVVSTTNTAKAVREGGGPADEPQAAGCGGFGKGNFHELFKRIEDYERTLNIGS